jgi:hypothetical protein
MKARNLFRNLTNPTAVDALVEEKAIRHPEVPFHSISYRISAAEAPALTGPAPLKLPTMAFLSAILPFVSNPVEPLTVENSLYVPSSVFVHL